MRSEPEAVRAALARRGAADGPGRGAGARPPTARAAAGAGGAARRAERRLQGDRRRQAARGGRCAGDRGDGAGGRARARAVGPGERGQGAARPGSERAAQPPRSRPPPTGHRAAGGGRGGPRRTRPPRAGRRADRHGVGGAGVGLALRLPARATLCCWSWRWCASRWSARAPRASSRWCRRCWCARARCSAPAFCPTPSSRSTAWPTTSCTWWAPRRWRWPRCTPARCSTPNGCRCATPASRPAFGARRARRARTRAASSACTSSTRSSCSRSWSPSSRLDEHERLLAIEEGILRELGIPYRVVDIAVDDLGASAARKYDCEAWLPGQERYRELTSCSNTTDFQARRLDVRWRPEGGRPAAPAHAQRHGGGGGAHDHRAAGERPARGRQRRAARGCWWSSGAPEAIAAGG